MGNEVGRCDDAGWVRQDVMPIGDEGKADFQLEGQHDSLNRIMRRVMLAEHRRWACERILKLQGQRILKVR